MIEQVIPLSKVAYVLPTEEKVLVLFVHGLNGGKKTWNKFVTALEDIEEIKGMYDVDRFEYPTSFFERFSNPLPTIPAIANGLRSYVNLACKPYKNIILVSHSMGGLICRRYLIDHVKQFNHEEFKIRSLLLYAVPNNGSDLAKVNILNPWHSQIKELSRNAGFISDLNGDWNIFGVNKLTDVKYIIAGRDEIVARDSAVNYWGNPSIDTDLPKNHKNIIHPLPKNDISLLALVNQILNVFNTSLQENDEAYSVEDEILDYDDEEREENLDKF
ncbi:esterase/lipase family protein [Mucilaginibacter calamicampi]|uniref:Esterase/lipase family protein n=1 Tax=Mucilaginibacter calamicampi TaxID=1302352 RepID=A0ABW2YUS0_9SPHI